MDDEIKVNSGLHTDDTINVPCDGRVHINLGRPDEDEDIYLLPSIAQIIKPHQIGGVRFLYDTVVETLDKFCSTIGAGCILAHSMGLGKTLQVISLIEVLYRYTKIKSVVIVVPLCVISQWSEEFDRFLPEQQRNFKVFSQHVTLNDWIETGGVLLIGYDALRIALSTNTEEHLRAAIQKTELLICDEGHRLKNQQSITTKTLSSIQCQRKIILTGYPFQNHLLEYWTMVNFVRPNYLPGLEHFVNIFKKPIEKGQFTDSTEDEIRLMNERCRLLHSLLEPIIQRRSNAVLLNQLPTKFDCTIFIKMSAVQTTLYNSLIDERMKMPLLTRASFCRKILNHPDLLLKSDAEDCDDLQEFIYGEENEKTIVENNQGNLWFKKHMTNYDTNNLENSPKIQILLALIASIISFRPDEKIIVFSLSTATLDLIEYFVGIQLKLENGWQYLRKIMQHPTQPTKTLNLLSLGIDGKTSINTRNSLISEYNVNPFIKLILLSTKASSLGLNLTAATRVVIFEPSWNPCDDQQASSRVFRFGQTKPTYIYRLVVDHSFELAILYRQNNKISMSNRLIDNMLKNNKFTIETLRLFRKTKDVECNDLKSDRFCNDFVIRRIVDQYAILLSQPPTYD
ncbi:helicase ARIP4-like [Bradysia coprophila]|uniref:helicase ARIP4-like n=1 Tax=Bradysia coprophila TaxID=38358 RepID=UPI00187DABBF|nr:helicase ARIP4-like [Bradysia coprophila]